MRGKVQISIDRGGTFTDIWANIPGKGEVIFKLLSVDRDNYDDAPTEGVRRVLELFTQEKVDKGTKLDGNLIEWIRMGTTVGTNALLEKKGDKFLYITTQSFKDVLEIGTQARPDLFDLHVRKTTPLYSEVLEVEERITIETASDDPNQTHVEPDIDKKVVLTPSGHFVRIIKTLNKNKVCEDLRGYYNKGYRNIAVCLAHSYVYNKHELDIQAIAREIGFTYISLSSNISPSIGLLNRGNSVCVSAYLTPHVCRYVEKFLFAFNACPTVEFMKSDGGLVQAKGLNGLNSILSGPAGGAVGFARTAYNGDHPIIGFDMGGTSTDVCRFHKNHEIAYENNISNVDIVAPQLQIHTVAAGGGSILKFEKGLFHVGPESSGAHPGPACYRKGGPLTITDANLLLGRLDVSQFPKIFGAGADQPLDELVTKSKFKSLTAKINEDSGTQLSIYDIALGYLEVANETMARSIREISEARGFSTSDHILTAFGGAGGQHCCSIAKTLGIGTVVIHKYSSILSSYGMAMADRTHELREIFHGLFSLECLKLALEKTGPMIKSIERYFDEKPENLDILTLTFETTLGLKFKNSNTVMPVFIDKNASTEAVLYDFYQDHEREFGFLPSSETEIFIEYVRVKGTLSSKFAREKPTYQEEVENARKRGFTLAIPSKMKHVYFHVKPVLIPVYRLGGLNGGDLIKGPALITEDTQTILIEPYCQAIVTSEHLYIEIGNSEKKKTLKSDNLILDTSPILLSVFSNRFMSIAEQMGRTLQRTSVSTSIKERLDFSCAIFSADGGLVANAPHIPVHLGSMQYAIQYQHKLWKGRLVPGDVLVSNHPEAGGTHLPDITVVTPVFSDDSVVFYVASRGHHQDIGGIGITAMMPNSKELMQEGVSIKSFKIVEAGKFNEEGIRALFSEPAKYPGSSATRNIENNLSDLKAQISANQRGITLVKNLFGEYGYDVVQHYMQAIRENAEKAVRGFLKEQSLAHQGKPLTAVDYFDDGTEIKVTISIDSNKGEALFDFEGTGEEVYGCMNSPPSITHSCVMYVLRCLINQKIPLNQGCLTPCKFNLPEGSILNPTGFVAICGSTISGQRITDVLLKAFRSCAASQGCANSFGFGTGGKDITTGKTLRGFTYAEALGGGVGAGPWGGKAADSCNVHCTNTRSTDIEIIEMRTPVIVTKWEIRRNSGGNGKYKGGDGSTREIEARIPLRVSILSERRVFAPYGLEGGEDGSKGVNLWYRKQIDNSFSLTRIGNKEIFDIAVGDRVQINTPGGGGYGKSLSGS